MTSPLAQEVARRYVSSARVAGRYLQAKASLGPAIRELSKGNVDVAAVKEALMALDVQPNGERWKIHADWYYGLGNRNQARAGQLIRALVRIVAYPDDGEPVPAKAIANGLKWLEKTKQTERTFAHGAFEISPMGVTRPQVDDALAALDKAAKALQAKFPKVLYGKVFVTKTLPRSHRGAVAQYTEEGDVLYLSTKAKSTTGDVYAICHEFGHRFDAKFWRNKTQREEFNRLSVMPEYGKIVFDAALRRKLADEFMGTIEARKVGQPSAVSELLSQWLDHQMARNLNLLRSLSQRAVKGDDEAAGELRELMRGDKDVTVQTQEVVRKPLHVTEYGKRSPTENFAEAFAHLVLGMAMPAEIAAIMTELS